uniref:C2H2-type domain-containing protein n=1 Tax=Caenorhabditis japonica TaxID=281687 RepID=A0A8R1HPW9_CAEJA
MPAVNRGKLKRFSLATPSETSESSEGSRTTSPVGSEQMEVSSFSTPQENESSDFTITENPQRTDSRGKTVAMSIGKPRLTANGKRIGRPPGSFKTHRILSGSQGGILPSPMTCRWDNCNSDFYSVEAIVQHMFENHAKPKDCVCLWAGCDNRVFKSYYMLVGHIRSHTGERPMKCTHPGCTKAYKTRENLNTHMRTHTGEKPYECQFVNCFKRFTNASDRGKHENRCHSNKKEYVCDVENCKKSYTDPSSLRKHVICVHGQEAQENRKKVKVRWVYRRDGQKVPDKSIENSPPRKMDQPTNNVEEPDSILQASETEETLVVENVKQEVVTPPQPEPIMRSAFRPVIPKANVLNNLMMMNYPLSINANDQAQSLIMQYINAQANNLQQSSSLNALSAFSALASQTSQVPQVPQMFNPLVTPSPSPTMMMGMFNLGANVGFNPTLTSEALMKFF